MTVATSAALAMAGSLFIVGPAHADPSASDWAAIRKCESSGNYSINTGNGYYGAYQFDLPTWRSVGGTGRPDQASPAEQDYRALILYRQRGWSPWICAALVGLQEDGDAGSKVMPERGDFPSADSPGADDGPAVGTPNAPAYPGAIMRRGSSSEELRTWQKQMGNMGYGLVGTGYFGPNTEQAVRDLQRKAGLNVVGYIGPKTWAAAWNLANSRNPQPTPTTGGSAPAFPGTLSLGAEGAALQAFQKQLGSAYGLTGTGYFGPHTAAAVRKLQTAKGLPVTGVIDEATWKAAWPASGTPSSYVPATNESCSVGASTAPAFGGQTMVPGKTYRALQCFQRQLGSKGYGLTGTGYFGNATKSAVAKVQSGNGLPASGVVDEATWKAAWEGK